MITPKKGTKEFTSNYKLYWLGISLALAREDVYDAGESVSDFTKILIEYFQKISSRAVVGGSREDFNMGVNTVVEVNELSLDAEKQVKAQSLKDGGSQRALFESYANKLVLSCCDSVDVVKDYHDIDCVPMHQFEIKVKQGVNQWRFEIESNDITDFNKDHTTVYLNGKSEINLSQEGEVICRVIQDAITRLAVDSAITYFSDLLQKKNQARDNSEPLESKSTSTQEDLQSHRKNKASGLFGACDMQEILSSHEDRQDKKLIDRVPADPRLLQDWLLGDYLREV